MAELQEFSQDVDVDISLPELEYIEAKFAAEKADGDVSEDTRFVYAWALIRSRYRDDRLIGIQEFETIMERYPHRRRECMYYLASANYKIGEYRRALKCIQELSKNEPENLQVQSLKDKIEKKLTNDGILGLAIAGGVAAAALGILFAFQRSRRR